MIWPFLAIHKKCSYYYRRMHRHLEAENGEKPIYLCVYENNACAKKLYESIGYQFIKEFDADVELIYRKV